MLRNSPRRIAVWAGILGGAALFASSAAAGQNLDFRGQLSFWLAGHDRPASEGAAGLRYIPSFSLKQDLGRGASLDAEVSLNTYVSPAGPHVRFRGGKRRPQALSGLGPFLHRPLRSPGGPAEDQLRLGACSCAR